MKCDRQDGKLCVNCGEARQRKCKAEVSLSELRDMQFGRTPPRSVRITCVQAKALAGVWGVPLTKDETAELFPGESDPTLIGNRIEALTKAIGIPPCGGCGQRRDWLNRAHVYLREVAAAALGG